MLSFFYFVFQQIKIKHEKKKELQSKYSETYRKLDEDDDFNKIKQRHSNFHHLAKNIYEAVTVFGIIYHKGNIKRMFHGINKNMIFTQMGASIFSIFFSSAFLICFDNLILCHIK